MDLAEFLLARIAEDEDLARRTPRASWPWNPARVLADCEAKRRIVGLHTPDHECTDGSDHYPGVFGALDGFQLCETLKALAIPYAGHPDYRQEWKP